MITNEQLNIEKLIVIDNTGMPKAPTIRQLVDADVRALYARDDSPNKERYIQECIVIYYLGDPKSPARQSGLTDKEALVMAIEQAGLKSNYIPDKLVLKLIKKYYAQNITDVIIQGVIPFEVWVRNRILTQIKAMGIEENKYTAVNAILRNTEKQN